METAAPSTYRLAAAVRLRLLGTVLVAVGVVVAVVAVLVAVTGLPGGVLAATLLLGLGALVLAGLGLVRARPLVTLDEAGYRVRLLRGAGVTTARWAEVEDVVTVVVAGDDCVMLRLRDGRSTTIPVAVLDARREDFVQDLRDHLDRGHGYRRIGRRGGPAPR